MNLRKFQAKWLTSDDDDKSEVLLVADLTDESEFLENLRYWRIGIDKFNQVNLVSLDSDYQVSFLNFICLTDRIFQIYRWATPECFYELTGLILCLSSIQKKYVLHKQYPDKVPLISELPQNLLEGLLNAHTRLIYRRASESDRIHPPSTH